MRHAALRAAVVETARAMNRAGINSGTSGNVGARVAGGLLVTPTGVPYDELDPAGVVELAVDGAAAEEGALLPSSEWRLHRDVLAARPEVGAVVHTHPTSATALSCLGRGIPAFHYLVARAGGAIACAPYATYGTEELSAHAVAALEGRRACLLANHGMVATGATLPEALGLAVEVEHLAATYLAALAVGEPNLLEPAEMARVAERLAGYGQQRRPDDG